MNDSDKKTAEQWFAEKHPMAWLHAAAAALHGWPVGVELTADEYEKALEAAAHVTVH